MTVATESGPSGPVTRTQVFSTTGGISLAPELVIDVTVDPKLDTDGIDVDGAIAAYKGLITVYDEAVSAPKKDWTDEVHKYAIDPAASALIDDIGGWASHGAYVVGHTLYMAEVESLSPKRIGLAICLDNRGSDILDADSDHSVRAGSGGRFMQTATVAKNNEGRWFVSDLEASSGEKC